MPNRFRITGEREYDVTVLKNDGIESMGCYKVYAKTTGDAMIKALRLVPPGKRRLVYSARAYRSRSRSKSS